MLYKHVRGTDEGLIYQLAELAHCTNYQRATPWSALLLCFESDMENEGSELCEQQVTVSYEVNSAQQKDAALFATATLLLPLMLPLCC